MTDKPLKTKERLRRLTQDSIKQAKNKVKKASKPDQEDKAMEE